MNSQYHDSNGKFKAGNKGGDGNPQIKRVAEYNAAIRKSVKQKDLVDIFKKLLALAKGGDIAATKIILDRCLGKVAREINVNTNQLQPITILFDEVKPE